MRGSSADGTIRTMIDHALFDPATIDPETIRINAEIVAAHAALPDPWSLPIAEVRGRSG